MKSATSRATEVVVIVALLSMVVIFLLFTKMVKKEDDQWLFLKRSTETSQPQLISITTEQACKAVASENNVKNGWNKNPERYYCYKAPEGILNEGLRIAIQRPWPADRWNPKE